MFHFSWHVLWACKCWFRLFVLKRYVSPLFAPVCHPPGDSDSESVTIAFWLHLPTQRYIGCHGFTKSLQTQMTQTHIPSFTDFFLMKTQEWKDCYAYRNIGIRGSNAKYETGMKELMPNCLWRGTGGYQDPRRWGKKGTIPGTTLSPPGWCPHGQRWVILMCH